MSRVHRPRRYVAQHWISIARPLLRYSQVRDAYVLRGVGRNVGPVLKVDRRRGGRHEGVDRRRSHARVA